LVALDLGGGLALVLIAVSVVTWLLRASLPDLDGKTRIPGLRASVVVERDALGVPTITERLVVSPGHEEQGLFQMIAGQSGHCLSPYYRTGHDAWVRGEPGPLLPGPARHTLRLLPVASRAIAN
jgi:penicillin amidase